MTKILHFADAHIDMANYGRHDPQSGLPLRVMDFLKSLDTIVDTAIEERVDLVLFAGDAYKDRSPAPTFQREWGRRVMRLSRAGIPTLLLVGNHDLSPALGRAHALENFDTLEVPYVRVIDKPCFLGPADLNGLPLQIMALPWVSRSGMLASQENGLELDEDEASDVYDQLVTRLIRVVDFWWEQRVDPALPVVMTAHCSVQGASYGGERLVMLGNDLVLPGSLVKDPRLAYVALGHIHKPQDLNQGEQPPVIYPGSIERVDIGEAGDDKYFVVAHIQSGQPTLPEWRKLEGVRPFIDRHVQLKNPEDVTGQLCQALQPVERLTDAVVRLVIDFPRTWETLIDEAALRELTAACFEFRLVRNPQIESRIRLPNDQIINSLPPVALLDLYWRANNTPSDDAQSLNNLALEIIRAAHES